MKLTNISVLIAALCLGSLQAGEPPFPQPVVVLFEGKGAAPVVITSAQPTQPVVITQKTGPLWTTSTGAQFIPVNINTKPMTHINEKSEK